jgi:hypothetical protein
LSPTSTQRSPTGGRLVLTVFVGALVAAVAFVAIRSGLGPLPDPEGCIAEAAGHHVSLDPEQSANAALVAAVGVRRGLPARAVSIALATTFQESKIRNLDHGDRDSLGLFQQRPSQGWGTPRQILDPYYATNAFYDALVQVEGYTKMEITDAAQAVQRSAFGDAYADHEADARVLASALTGYSEAALTCTVRPGQPEDQPEGASGLTPRASRMLANLQRAYGDLSVGGFAPAGVSTGHIPGSAHYEGRAVDVFFRPGTPDSTRRGWSLAQYAVANAERLGIETVIFDDRIWTASRSAEGWREYAEPASTGDPAIVQHLDHVHVDVV